MVGCPLGKVRWGTPPGKGQGDTPATDIWWPTWTSDLRSPEATSGGGHCMQAGGTHST